MIFNIIEKVSLFVSIHILKGSRKISHVKGIHVSLGIWISLEGTGDTQNTACVRGYTYHCDSAYASRGTISLYRHAMCTDIFAFCFY